MAAPSPVQQQHPKVPATRLAAGSSPSSKSQRTTSSPPRHPPSPSSSSSPSTTSAVAAALQNAAAASLWISLSASVILFNKHILAFSGFPFPITLTGFHMAFSWACASALIHCTSLVELPTMTTTTTTTTKGAADGGSSSSSATTRTTTSQKGLDARTYLRRIAPVGALFAGTLWLGNAAYLHLSVSFIQMLKALMPAAVYGVGCLLGTETFARSRAVNMAVVTFGVAAASAGEVSLSLLGVALQLGSVATESTRLALVQILLQQKKVKKPSSSSRPSSSSSAPESSSSSKIALNPVTTMYYLAPVSLLCLSLPWLAFERSRLVAAWGAGGGGGAAGSSPPPPTSPYYLLDPSHALDSSWWRLGVSPLTLLANAALAFALNLSVFLLIGKTSALAMNVAGVVKDWMLIGLSALLFRAPVTPLNLAGYSVAFAGVCWYNKAKFDEMKASAAAAAAAVVSPSGASASAAAGATEEGGEREMELKPLMSSSSNATAAAAIAAAAAALGDDRKIKAGRAV